MKEELANIHDTRLANVASRAVGVPESDDSSEKPWHIAVVLNNTEVSSSRKLQGMGFKSYVPARTEVVVWKNGRKKKREKVLIPSMVFVRCSERERLEIVKAPFIKYFLVDRAKPKTNGLKHPVAVVPDEQIKKLQFLLDQDNQEVSLEPATINVGDSIRVVRGCLAGFEGKICFCNGLKKIGVLIDGLGYACVNIDIKDIEIIKNRKTKQTTSI